MIKLTLSKKIIKNKTIFITGGTGSFGRKLTKVLLNSFQPKKIIIFSRDEFKQFEMSNELKKYEKKMRFFLGDIRDANRLNIGTRNVDILIHAAALKHLHIAEYNPFEFVKTNINGSENVINACLINKVKKVIALSTDKASSPINLYGATKLTADKLFVTANYYKGIDNVDFSVVRYGNVFGSRGSVVPLLLNTLRNKNKIFKLTDDKMTRFTLTLEEAVNFVLNSLEIMKGGEIFIPKIPSYRLSDLIKLFENKIKIVKMGIRKGEKMHEEMISEFDSDVCYEFKNNFTIMPDQSYISWNIKRMVKINNGKKCTNKFVYNSKINNFLNSTELKKLLKGLEKNF